MSDTAGATRQPTERHELGDIEVDDNHECYDVIRVEYIRKADERDICPFCESGENVEWVDEIGLGGEWRKARYECDCGAHGESYWTWRAGTMEADEDE